MTPTKIYYPNMGAVRYVLSLAVIIAHVNLLAGHDVPFVMSSFDAVGGFFALSGYLMYPSFMKHHDLLRYTAQRARRILPPYIFIVLLCAFTLWSVSSLPVARYFTDIAFWKYLGANLVFLNWLQPSLPGVFEGGAFVEPAVNGSLWTLKVEWCLYLSVPLFVWLTRRLRTGKQPAAVAVIALSIAYRIFLLHLYGETGREMYLILSRQIFGQLSYFYVGMLLYFNRGFFMRHTGTVCLAGLALYLAVPYIPYGNILVSPIAISWLVLGCACWPRAILPTSERHNISYEMYLFHYPLIQLSICLGVNVNAAVDLAVVIVASAVLAYLVHRYVDVRIWKCRRPAETNARE